MTIGQMCATWHASITRMFKCSLHASRNNIGCTSRGCGPRAAPSKPMICMSVSTLFQALFCLSRCTLGGLAAFSAAKPRGPLTWKACQFPMTTWGSTACTPGLSQISPTWVKQHFRPPRLTVCCGFFGFATKMFPLRPPCHRFTEVSSRLIRKAGFPAGSSPQQYRHHCQTANA